MDGSDALGVSGGGVDVGAALDEEAGYVGVVEEDRQAEGRITVVREHVEHIRIGGQLPFDALQIAERAGLGERYRSAALDQQPGDVVLAVVDRREDRGGRAVVRLQQRGIRVQQLSHACGVAFLDRVRQFAHGARFYAG